MSGGGGRFKVVLLGEGRVGKTCLLLRYCQDRFDGRQTSTLDASYLDKSVTVDGQVGLWDICATQRHHLSIWDTAGQERFHALAPLYYRDADGAILVYDITDLQSFQRVRHWVTELQRMAPKGITICIAGNKSDLEKSRNVPVDAAEKFAADVGATHHLTSAKSGEGVADAFADLARRMANKPTSGGRGRRSGAASGGGGVRERRSRPSGRVIVDDTDEPPKKDCC